MFQSMSKKKTYEEEGQTDENITEKKLPRIAEKFTSFSVSFHRPYLWHTE